MDKPKLKISSKDKRRRRAEATQWWLKMRAIESREEDISAWLDWQGRDLRNAEAFEYIRAFADRIRATDSKDLADLVAEFSGPSTSVRATRRWLAWSVSVACPLVVIAASLIGYHSLSEPEGRRVRLEYQTPVAINREIALPDGSNVLLGAESELNASFTASARRVELRDGEAYFKVKHDERRPFYVRAGLLTIRDVGTAFNVNKAGQRISVTVVEGHVQVTEANAQMGNSGAENSLDIGAGQELLYTPGMAGLRVSRVDPPDALGWSRQRLQFVNEPMAAVILNINRYAQPPLKIGDPAIARLTFTGTVDLRNLDRWLAALQTIFPVKVEYGAKGDVIVPVAAPSHR
jgi:transmembrane sensor